MDAQAVVMIHGLCDDAAALHDLTQRLRRQRLRTVLVAADAELTAKAVGALLDPLRLRSAMLVGDLTGAELAWDLATTFPERFTGLVAIDRGHPRVPDVGGIIRDEHCPHAHTDTTILVSNRAADSIARASRRYVCGEFRLRELAGWRGSQHFRTQLTMEILLRRVCWP